MHSIPHRSSRVLLGIVNVRGEIHLCISLKTLLGIEMVESAPNDGKAQTRMLIATINEQPMAFEVDAISGIHSYHPNKLKAVPATLPKEVSACSMGLLRWKERHITVLDSRLLAEKISRSFT